MSSRHLQAKYILHGFNNFRQNETCSENTLFPQQTNKIKYYLFYTSKFHCIVPCLIVYVWSTVRAELELLLVEFVSDLCI